MSELKPCPFCGAKSFVCPSRANAKAVKEYVAVCAGKCDSRSGYYLTKKEAEDAWNKRHCEDKLQDSIDALEWMIECDNFNIGRCKNADAARECIATREAALAAVEKK